MKCAGSSRAGLDARLVFRPEAESDVLDARTWYDDQQLGLGQAFAAEVARVLAGIVEHLFVYPRVHGETRRGLVRRFPYAIYFRDVSRGCRPGRSAWSTTSAALALAALKR